MGGFSGSFFFRGFSTFALGFFKVLFRYFDVFFDYFQINFFDRGNFFVGFFHHWADDMYADMLFIFHHRFVYLSLAFIDLPENIMGVGIT